MSAGGRTRHGSGPLRRRSVGINTHRRRRKDTVEPTGPDQLPVWIDGAHCGHGSAVFVGVAGWKKGGNLPARVASAERRKCLRPQRSSSSCDVIDRKDEAHRRRREERRSSVRFEPVVSLVLHEDPRMVFSSHLRHSLTPSSPPCEDPLALREHLPSFRALQCLSLSFSRLHPPLILPSSSSPPPFPSRSSQASSLWFSPSLFPHPALPCLTEFPPSIGHTPWDSSLFRLPHVPFADFLRSLGRSRDQPQ